MNFYMNILILFIDILIFSSIIYNIKKKRLINFNIMFNTYFICYSSTVLLKLTNTVDSYNYIYMYILILIGYICFNISYLLLKVKTNKKKYSENILKKILYIFFILGTLIEIYVYSHINLKEYFLASRSEKMLLISKFSKFEFFYIFLISAMNISIILKRSNKKKLIYKIIFITTFLNCLIISLFEISRANLFLILISLLYLYQDKIKRKWFIIYGGTVVIISVMWKAFLSNLYYGNKSILDISFKIPSEFYVWYEIGNNVLKDFNLNKIDFMYGKSYLETFINLIYPFFNFEPLSIWYVKRYEYNIYISGGGRGFSSVVEGYLNFGILGVVLYFTLLGIISKYFDIRMKKDIKILLIGILFLSNTHKFIRSESYSVFKTITWFGMYPIIILFLLFRLKIFKNK